MSWVTHGPSGSALVPAEDPEQAVERILTLVRERIPRRFGLDPVRDIQVLCPMNRGGAGARSLNVELQAALNPAGEEKVERFGWTFSPGDKVMQIENDYDKDVYNGDITPLLRGLSRRLRRRGRHRRRRPRLCRRVPADGAHPARCAVHDRSAQRGGRTHDPAPRLSRQPTAAEAG